jgi:hypothetical protein
MARGQRSSDAELCRAARNLIMAHGAQAAGVAETRARRLDECGEDEVAQTWRQISAFVRAIERGKNPCARNKGASGRQSALVPPGDAVPAARPAPITPIHAPAEVSRVAGMLTPEYLAGDIIRESADLEHWVATTPNEAARSIGLAAPK